ncbi:hypothetical protein M3J09_009068 [Ascochyta lentis]
MFFQFSVWLAAGIIATPTSYGGNGHGPKRLIIDTDLIDFVDDPLAIGLANVFQSRAEANVLGIVSSVFSRYVPPAIDAINTYYSYGDIPVAIQKPVDNTTRNPTFPQDNEYLTGLTLGFPQDIGDGSNTTEPVALYRRILESSPNHSITIANIGFHDNLYNLLLSPPDKISSLSGPELVKKKIAELVVQGNPNGISFNFEGNDPSTVLFGRRLTTELDIKTNPVAYAAATSIGVDNVHESWDSTAIYYAVRGLDDAYRFERKRGEIYFFENGTAAWNYRSPSRLQRSIDLKINNTTLAGRLEGLLLSKP